MNTSLTIRSIFAGAVLGSAVAAYPLTLGPVTGSTVIGQPLQLSAPIQLDDAMQGNATGCMAAEVMYGERAIAGIKVDLSADGQLARIVSTTLVDEPFVTLLLRAGCGIRSTRRYVLLAEAPQAESMVLEAARSMGFGASMGSAPASASHGTVPSTTAAPSAGAAAAPNRYRQAAVRSPGREARPQLLPASGRLQLALWEPGSEGFPWLRASTELLSMPRADASHRVAATVLWRALNAQPQDLLRTAERLRGLEGEVVSLRGLTGRHRTEISSARESLRETRSQRYTNLALVMSLALLAGGSAAVFWHRSRRIAALAPFASRYPPVEPRFEPCLVEDQATAPVAAGVEQGLPTSTPAPTPITLQPPVVAPQEAEPAPPILVPIDFSTGAPLMPGDGSVADDYSTPLKVVALHDAQQQSEFFCSLGQFDEAIAVLSSHLHESKDTPVLAFMELFRIYHGLGRRGDYEQLQSAFCTIFGIDVGGFDEYSDEQRELELYPVPLSRIAASWPAAASLDVIEKLLLKRPGSAREMLSIEAYRDLIWLYTLGQDVGRSTRLPAGLQLVGGTDLPNDHFILPWAFGDEQEPQELSLDRLNAIDVASHLSRFAVDIDLTASGSALQQSRLDDRKASDKVWTEAAAVRPLATETETETETETATATAAEAEAEAEDAFDAVMEYHSRKNAR